MGDAAGIGPEVTLKALASPAVARVVKPILVGDPGVFADTAKRLGIRIKFVEIDGATGRWSMAVLPTSSLPASLRKPGTPKTKRQAAACGEAAYRAILGAVGLVHNGEAAGIVTAPISKAHLVAAGHDYPGHTELLAELAGKVPVRMMLAGPQLRVVLVTIHMALAEVPRRLTRANIYETIRITDAAMRRQYRIRSPRIAVAGLNPHAGEGGLFGNEEKRFIAPAIAAAQRAGIKASGPLAADGMFALAAQGQFDALVCMYHDQGLAPFKLQHFADGVNVTLGLPFVRTSPDHGTAFDIAGKGKADARSMAAALLLAAKLAQG
ncbi:MAG: 4-hydroxythreonine-4-phosphate dehydrogenase PdxA [Deltaproteobacteria bacterium]|nr:4-hydroxythreonine-4-phosphate dehydrogenase PdxA [Deltaproteobacteria bacterium]